MLILHLLLLFPTSHLQNDAMYLVLLHGREILLKYNKD